jgi:hypothetical protein
MESSARLCQQVRPDRAAGSQPRGLAGRAEQRWHLYAAPTIAAYRGNGDPAMDAILDHVRS